MALAQLELVAQPSFFVWCVHATAHIPQLVRQLGPVRDSWAYGMESFLGYMKRAGDFSAQAAVEHDHMGFRFSAGANSSGAASFQA